MTERVRVLIVDDEERVRNSLARLISRRLAPDRDVVIDTADGVTRALEQFERDAYDLVLTDYRMPGGTGAELLTLVEARWPSTRRLLMSGYGDIDERLRLERPTAVERVVGKPWDSTALLAALRDLLWPS